MAHQPHLPAVDAAGGIQVAEVGAHADAAELARLRINPGQRYRGAPHDVVFIGEHRRRRHRYHQRNRRRHGRQRRAPWHARVPIFRSSSGCSFALAELHPVSESIDDTSQAARFEDQKQHDQQAEQHLARRRQETRRTRSERAGNQGEHSRRGRS